MTEIEQLKLKIEYLEDNIMRLELRLKNAMSFIQMSLNNKEEPDVQKSKGFKRGMLTLYR